MILVVNVYGCLIRSSLIIGSVNDRQVSLPVSTNYNRIVTVASLDSKKGIQQQLEAYKILAKYRHDWHVDIIGDGL